MASVKILALLLIAFILVFVVDATCSTRPTLRLYSGYSSSHHLRDSVKEVQGILNEKAGADLVVDGYFGRRTDYAVRGWQREEGLTVDGVVGRGTWASLCESVPDPANDGLVGPVGRCGAGSWPAGTYTDQIAKRAWNSGGKSFYDLALDAGVKEGVHPAMIAAHMVHESSMGRHDKYRRCIASAGRSILTGCQWYPDCSGNCGCTGSAVKSDKHQVECTARTDKNAYTEAIHGKSTGNGAYVKCNAHKRNPEKMWKCILCVYQGNYASDLTKKGKPYFTKDGTCEYAENFLGTVCDWEQYFAFYAGL